MDQWLLLIEDTEELIGVSGSRAKKLYLCKCTEEIHTNSSKSPGSKTGCDAHCPIVGNQNDWTCSLVLKIHLEVHSHYLT